MKKNYLHGMLSYRFTKLFHAIFTSVYIMLIFYPIKWWYCKNFKIWWNTFAYFCCRWIFKIIFTFFNLFYYTFKVCINNKLCFSRFLILIKFLYFRVFRRHNYVTKVFIFTYFFMRFKFFFFCRSMKQLWH